MRMRSLPLALTGLNLVLLIWLVATTSGVAQGQASAPVVRASAIELVDDAGIVRAQLIVTPEGNETLLRMRDARGDVRLKLGVSEEGSGLVMADQTAQPGLHVNAKRGSTFLTLTDTGGQPKVIRASDP
jgi:hypothetical protein